jgi:beta-mannanase
MGNARIRVGHELNGTWYRWSATTNPTAYAAYYRQIVTAMRSVPGQAFTFEWNVSIGITNFDATTAYPGDAYVDYIGQDIYDVKWGDEDATPQQRWASKLAPAWGQYRHGLQFWADFARAHGKQIAFSEWGLTDKYAQMANGGGGGDSPYFIEQMQKWFAANPTAYEVYFNEDAHDGKHDLGNAEFATAASRYRVLF